MAAAVLGHAARRLGGGPLRQTQETAVSRLSTRFGHTKAQPQPNCSCGKFEKDDFMKGMQKKKEELYETMAEWHKKYGDDMDKAWLMNRALLRQLSHHVKRREDPTWEWARTTEANQNFLGTTGVVTVSVWGPYLFYKALSGVVHWVWLDEK